MQTLAKIILGKNIAELRKYFSIVLGTEFFLLDAFFFIFGIDRNFSPALFIDHFFITNDIIDDISIEISIDESENINQKQSQNAVGVEIFLIVDLQDNYIHEFEEIVSIVFDQLNSYFFKINQNL